MAFSNSPGKRGTTTAALRSALGRAMGKHSANGASGSGDHALPHAPEATGIKQDAANSLIENEILPAFLSARKAGFAHKTIAPNSTSSRSVSESQARRFAELPLHLESASLVDEIKNLLDEGIAMEAIYDELLTPAARWLGEMWEQDSCDFVDVTMGLWRLQEVMREISLIASPVTENQAAVEKTAIFFPMPGDQHFMGSQMLGDVFTRAGWGASVLTQPRRSDILGILSKEHFDLVGLTVSRDCPSAALRNMISAMRIASRNPVLTILAGGRMINLNPAIVAEVGADGTGTDARATIHLAERLVKSSKVRAQTLI